MTADEGNVNSSARENGASAYHHGNLRQALIASGLLSLTQGDSVGISLRQIARSVGVSAPSVYRHFPNKQALIDALCAEGSVMLAAVLRAANSAAGGGQSGLDASGLAYVRFALDNPALFRLMSNTGASYGDAESPAMQELLSCVATLLPRQASASQARTRALHAWSVARGVAMLVLEGQIPDDDKTILEVIRTPKA